LIPYSPHSRDWNFPGGGGPFSMNLEFPEGWDILEKTPSKGVGNDISWNDTIKKIVNYELLPKE